MNLKIIKLVGAFILFIAATKGIVEMFGEESGAGLGGAIMGYLIIVAIAFWLLYSTTESYQEKRTSKYDNKETDKSDEHYSFVKEREQLINLEAKGLLSIDEFELKISILDNKEIDSRLTKSEEYFQLKNLFDSNILDKTEFEEKVLLLRKSNLKPIEKPSIKSNENEVPSEVVILVILIIVVLVCIATFY